jgi:hypothetical protein
VKAAFGLFVVSLPRLRCRQQVERGYNQKSLPTTKVLDAVVSWVRCCSFRLNVTGRRIFQASRDNETIC